METLLTSPSSISSISATFSVRPPKNPSQISPPFLLPFPIKPPQNLFFTIFSPSSPNSCSSSPLKPRASLLSSSSTSTASLPFASISSSSAHRRHWMVLMEDPPQELNYKPQIVDYYVRILQRVIGSEIDAQMCIYDASCSENFGFCCDIDHEAADELARLPGVHSVRPDLDMNSTSKDYTCSPIQTGDPSSIRSKSSLLFAPGTSKRWIVRMEKPPTVLITKAQIVDYYTRVLTKVMGNETDAQMCIYHVSTDSNYGFCCELNNACAHELAGVPGVLSIHLDENFESDAKDYGGEKLNSGGPQDSSSQNQVTNIRTKKLFVTGLSFYTSEKTLRAAFEGFGALVEAKVIMDKISKRSKGYAFVEYTTEESAVAALREMNGKIINGWMITVDVAKKNPPKHPRGRT